MKLKAAMAVSGLTLAVSASCVGLAHAAAELLPASGTEVLVQTSGGLTNILVSNVSANSSASANDRIGTAFGSAVVIGAPSYAYATTDRFAYASADSSYHFEVVGPAGESATVDMNALLLASVKFAQNYAGAELTLFSPCGEPGGNCVIYVDDSIYVGLGVDIQYDASKITTSLNLPTNTPFIVNLQTVSANVNGTGKSLAFADPFFYFDPTFLADNPGYSLEFSPGIINSPGGPPPVPEPATWAIMLMGFGGLGAAMRSQRKTLSDSIAD